MQEATFSNVAGRQAFAWIHLNSLSPLIEIVATAAEEARRSAEDSLDFAELVLLLLLLAKLVPLVASFVFGYVPTLASVERALGWMDAWRL